METTDAALVQRRYARFAGFLLLGVIAVAVGAGAMLSHLAGDGPFAETAARIAASEHWYRGALAALVVVSLGSACLAFALYVTLRPVSPTVALLAMIFGLADSLLALVVRMSGFVKVQLYVSALTAGDGQAAVRQLADLMETIAGVTENIGGIAFGLGMLLFFSLFFKSRYIPRALAAVGVAAAALWVAAYVATLVFPEHHERFLALCLPPMGLADLGTGVYLTLFAVKVESRPA
jgi:hypothetical protein